MSLPPNQPMKKYLFRETIVIEVEMTSDSEDTVMHECTNFVCDLLRKGRIRAEMDNSDVHTYRINSDGADVQINN